MYYLCIIYIYIWKHPFLFILRRSFSSIYEAEICWHLPFQLAICPVQYIILHPYYIYFLNNTRFSSYMNLLHPPPRVFITGIAQHVVSCARCYFLLPIELCIRNFFQREVSSERNCNRNFLRTTYWPDGRLLHFSSLYMYPPLQFWNSMWKSYSPIPTTFT